MESNPFLVQLTNPNPRSEPESKPVSQIGTDCFDFEFPVTTSGARENPAVPNDIVFCGKVINLEIEPRGKNKNPFLLLKSESSGKLNPSRSNGIVDSVRFPSTGENRWRRSGSNRKHHSGLFGILKFPLQMELSDIKMRQERIEPLRLWMPKLAADGDGGSVSRGSRESSWDLVRPLRRRNQLMNALAKATFGCIPHV